MSSPPLTAAEIITVIEDMAEDTGEVQYLVLLALLSIMSPESFRRASTTAALARATLPQILAELQRRGAGEA